MSENNVNSTEEIVLSVEMGDAVSAQTAEAYAVGKRGGVDVAETDPTWHNNAKYYAEQAEEAAGEAQGAEEAAQRAETAQAAAEAARDRAEAIGAGAAQSAAAAAESAQAAATAKTGAETAQSAAAGSATAAEGSAGRASQSATAAAGSATAAGTAKTAAETARDAAAGSATAAAGSATAADQSAQAAAASAQAAEDVAESIPADYSQLSDDVSGLKSAFEQLDANVITESAGPSPIVSIADGADGMPMRKVEVAIEPVQDLHGYDAPWPAGGGANQWNEDWEAYGTSQIKSKTRIPVTAGATYFWCGPIVTAYEFENLTDSNIGTMTIQPNSQVTIPSGVNYLMIYSATGYGRTYLNNWALNYPATVTTYSPYSNICPISGWTGAKVTRTGKNLLSMPFVDYRSASVSKNDCFFLKQGLYTFSFAETSETSWRFVLRLVDALGNEIIDASPAGIVMPYRSGVHGYTNGTNISYKNFSFTINKDCYARILFWGGSTSTSSTFNGAMLSVGSTALPYEPYQGQTYEVTFPADPGTVYGGTLDVASGKLVVDRVCRTYDGSSDEAWRYFEIDSGNLFRIAVPDRQSGNLTASAPNIAYFKSNSYKPAANNTYARTNGTFCGASTNVDFINNSFATVEEWRTYLAENNVQFCYLLANPQEITLSPTEITTLLGSNNVFANCGDTAITYPADTKMYIDRKITEAIANALNA